MCLQSAGVYQVCLPQVWGSPLLPAHGWQSPGLLKLLSEPDLSCCLIVAIRGLFENLHEWARDIAQLSYSTCLSTCLAGTTSGVWSLVLKKKERKTYLGHLTSRSPAFFRLKTDFSMTSKVQPWPAPSCACLCSLTLSSPAHCSHNTKAHSCLSICIYHFCCLEAALRVCMVPSPPSRKPPGPPGFPPSQLSAPLQAPLPCLFLRYCSSSYQNISL